MSTVIAGSNTTSTATVGSTYKVWKDRRLVFWGFLIFVLSISIPHMAYDIAANYPHDWWDTLASYGVAGFIEGTIFALTLAFYGISGGRYPAWRRLGVLSLITALSILTCHLNILYNHHFYQPALLSGAEDVPGATQLPDIIGLLPLLNVVIASLSVVFGKPATTDTRTAEQLAHDYEEAKEKERLHTAYAVEQAALRGQRLRGTIEGYTGLSFSRRKEAPTQQEQPSPPPSLGSEPTNALPSGTSEEGEKREQERVTDHTIHKIDIVPFPFDTRQETNIVLHDGQLVRVHTVECAAKKWEVSRSVIEGTDMWFSHMKGSVPVKVIPIDCRERIQRLAGKRSGKSMGTTRTKEKESMTQVLEGVGG